MTPMSTKSRDDIELAKTNVKIFKKVIQLCMHMYVSTKFHLINSCAMGITK
jgi:hypothetical protein